MECAPRWRPAFALPSPPRFAPRVTPLEPAPGLDRVLAALRGRRGLVALDGAGASPGEPPSGAPPSGEPRTGEPRTGEPAGFAVVGFEPLAGAPPPRRIGELAAYVARLAPAPGDPLEGPFHGGFLGALAYELGVEGEELVLPPDPWGLPRLVGGLYVDFVVLERPGPRAWLVLGEDPGDGRAPLADRRASVLAALHAAGAGEAAAAGAVAAGPPAFELVGELARRVPAALHMRRIEALRALIGAGELYQANLAHAFAGRTRGSPVDLYRHLSRASPAPHGGLLVFGPGAYASGGPEPPRTPRGALVSASPELLLEVQGDVARTRPIKGTAPRAEEPARDAELARALLASEKDRAELAMIVDLERNDLGRVARPGGVRVEDFPRLRSFAGVHHLTADVVAQLRPGVGAAEVLAALFPGGSVTGAPKLRAMEAIAELEGEGRGFFTGSLGFLDVRGNAAFDVLIRTFQWRPAEPAPGVGEGDGELLLHVGGGITWRSDPAAEEAETLVKAARLLAALGGPPYRG